MTTIEIFETFCVNFFQVVSWFSSNIRHVCEPIMPLLLLREHVSYLNLVNKATSLLYALVL